MYVHFHGVLTILAKIGGLPLSSERQRGRF